MRKIIFAVVLGVVLSGCVSTAVIADRLAEKSANFKEGQTTYKEVKAELGGNFGMAITPDGKRSVAYFGSSGNQLHLVFDKNDVLETKKLKD